MLRNPKRTARRATLLLARFIVKSRPSLIFVVVILTLFALAFSRIEAVRNECFNPHIQYAKNTY